MKRLLLLFLFPLVVHAQDLQTGVTFSDGDTVNAAALNNSVNNATILPTFYSNKGLSTPISSDLFLFYQGGTSSLKQTSMSTLFNVGLGFNTRNALTVLAGPATAGASAAAPTFRAISPHDTAGGTNNTVSNTIDASLARTFFRQLSANTGFTITNMIDGEAITVCVRQAASGGPWVAGFVSVFWSGTAPVQTPAANKNDLYTIIQINGIKYGTASQNH